jgi:hypothetical protein
MQMQQRGDGDASVEILDIDPESGSLFDAYGDESAYGDDASDWRAGDDLGHMEHNEPSTELIGVAEPGKSGKLSNRRVRHVAQEKPPAAMEEHGTGVLGKSRLEIARRPRHHLLPQEEIDFFRLRGFPGREIDNFCIELDRVDHEMLHGGNQSLARRHWQEHEWSTALMERLREAELQRGRMLLRDEVLEIVEIQRITFGISDRRIIHYAGRHD